MKKTPIEVVLPQDLTQSVDVESSTAMPPGKWSASAPLSVVRHRIHEATASDLIFAIEHILRAGEEVVGKRQDSKTGRNLQ